MDENKTEMTSDSLENVNGGTNQLSEHDKDRWRKIIRNAKRDGATLEEFLDTLGDMSPTLHNFIITSWGVIRAEDFRQK